MKDMLDKTEAENASLEEQLRNMAFENTALRRKHPQLNTNSFEQRAEWAMCFPMLDSATRRCSIIENMEKNGTYQTLIKTELDLL